MPHPLQDLEELYFECKDQEAKQIVLEIYQALMKKRIELASSEEKLDELQKQSKKFFGKVNKQLYTGST